MRYEDVRRAGGAERIWLRVKLAWIRLTHQGRGRDSLPLHLSDRELADIGLIRRPDIAPAWWRYR